MNDFYAPGALHPSAPIIAAAWSAVLKTQAVIHADEVIAFCRLTLADYKIPRDIVVRADLSR